MATKYIVKVTSEAREAEFEIMGEGKVCTDVKMKSLRYLKDDPNGGHSEVFHAHIFEGNDGPMSSNMVYVWVVLWGTIPEVIQEVETNLPMAMMETDAIWEGFEEDEGENICYTYPFAHDYGERWMNAAISQVLFSGQGRMVAAMFDREPESVRVLVPKYS